jgi:pimeloyl-ACP methyl ester carboxylesterase
MTPTDFLAEEEIDFYIPITRNNSIHGEHQEDLIACSLYKSLGPRTTTHIDGTGFGVDDSNKPVVVICHGSRSWRNQMLLAHLAGGLQKRLEYHTLRFDFTGNGHSTGSIFHHHDANHNYNGAEFHDLQTVLSFVQDQMKCRVACVIGHSQGAAAVLRTAQEQEIYDDADDDSSRRRIPCFVNLSGRFAVPHDEYHVEKRWGAKKAPWARNETKRIVWGPKAASRECVVTIDNVVQEPSRLDDSSLVQNNWKRAAAVLTIHGSKDDVVPVSHAQAFAKTIPNHELLIIEGADHNYNGLRHMPTMVDAVAQFVEKHDI